MSAGAAPIVVTFALDDAAQSFFDGLRRREFPPERNVLAAHLTAFHALPGEGLARWLGEVEQVLPREPLPMQVNGLRFLGRGVAYDLAGEAVEHLRAGLAAGWQDVLAPQDRQRWRPHVTVQNKVAPQRARELADRLAAGFQPFTAQAVGICLWHYRGGPWEPAARRDFHPVPS